MPTITATAYLSTPAAAGYLGLPPASFAMLAEDLRLLGARTRRRKMRTGAWSTWWERESLAKAMARIVENDAA